MLIIIIIVMMTIIIIMVLMIIIFMMLMIIIIMMMTSDRHNKQLEWSGDTKNHPKAEKRSKFKDIISKVVVVYQKKSTSSFG